MEEMDARPSRGRASGHDGRRGASPSPGEQHDGRDDRGLAQEAEALVPVNLRPVALEEEAEVLPHPLAVKVVAVEPHEGKGLQGRAMAGAGGGWRGGPQGASGAAQAGLLPQRRNDPEPRLGKGREAGPVEVRHVTFVTFNRPS